MKSLKVITVNRQLFLGGQIDVKLKKKQKLNFKLLTLC